MSTEQKCCEFVETVAIYAKSIGNIRIDPTEYRHPGGAHVMDKTIRCKLVADAGEAYCPKHKALAETSRADAQRKG